MANRGTSLANNSSRLNNSCPNTKSGNRNRTIVILIAPHEATSTVITKRFRTQNGRSAAGHSAALRLCI